MGVFADASDSAAVKRTIFAPFYQPGLPALIADGTVKYGDEVWYPASAEEAEETILSLTSATAEGGIDAMGPTEWERVIGQTSSTVTCNSAATWTSGGTISTYLEFCGATAWRTTAALP